MTISPAMIGAASGLTCGVVRHRPMYGVGSHRPMRGVANRHPTCGVASNPICVAVNRLMFDGANGPFRAKGSDPRIVRAYGRTPAATEIVVANPIPVHAMAPTTCCRMGSAGLTFGAEPTRQMS